jgi:methyltransferase (TIGR00027 family)
MVVALARGLASEEPALSRVCQDTYAAALLPEQLARGLRLIPRAGVSSLVRTLSGGLVDHLALRTALIDRALTQAVSEGIDQVVLLGAGFDARAHRMSALSACRVYEVDQPATQAQKREAARGLPVLASALSYVPVDFARTSLESALAGAGFEARRRSAWVWEGVTMYLREVALRETLATLDRLSAEASLLIATYLEPHLVAAGALAARLVRRAFTSMGEPIHYTASPEAFAQLLAGAGFIVLNDAAPKDAAPYYGVERQRPTSLTPRERIVVASKRGAQT